MSKKSSNPGPASVEKTVAQLQREVAKLDKTVARLQAAASKAGKLRATKLVVDSLDVVDGSGKVVASIDNKGNLFCRTVWASTGKNVRGVFIDGVTYRKVSAASLELIGPTGNNPVLEATQLGSGGQITLKSATSKQRLLLQGSGAPLIAYDDAGVEAVIVQSNVPAGGQINLLGTEKNSKAKAKLRVSHLSYAGELILTDANGNNVAKLP